MRFMLTVCWLALASLFLTDAARSELNGFITARGDQLYEGDKPFRFISFNIPNLQLVEDNFAPDAKTAWAWPNEFELNDALASVRQMGGTVARTYVLSVRRAGSDMEDHVYVRDPGDFNEEAFKALDLALEIANKHGVRLIIPLVDNWKWQGGIAEYAAFRGKPAEAFWTDDEVIADFEATVRHVLNRVNSRTGVAYRDDPALFGWETGNELDAPPAWTARIAKLIKSLDPNHLVIDGYSLHGVREESLADPNIDVVTTHHYPNVGKGEYIAPIRAARDKSRGRKPYFVGEFGFIPPEEIAAVYDEVIDTGVSGALLWSLRFHHRDGGFYWHSEPAVEGLYKAYHWPGFDSGAKYGEREVLRLTREKAFQVRGEEAPPLEVPAAPRLLSISDPAAISWQGSAGASAYSVERTANAAGPWTVIADRVDDTAVQYRPLFSDVAAEPGQCYFYRVTAKNTAGSSTPSNIIGPVAAEHRTLVDECRDISLVTKTIGNVQPVTGEDRQRREDLHRLRIPAGAAVIYRTNGPIDSWEAIFYLSESASDAAADSASLVDAFLSADGVEFTPITPEATLLDGSEVDKDYGYLPCLKLNARDIPASIIYLKLSPRQRGELAHLSIRSDRVLNPVSPRHSKRR
jgi:mannan endo-1,4-beta-mannosidase